MGSVLRGNGAFPSGLISRRPMVRFGSGTVVRTPAETGPSAGSGTGPLRCLDRVVSRLSFLLGELAKPSFMRRDVMSKANSHKEIAPILCSQFRCCFQLFEGTLALFERRSCDPLYQLRRGMQSDCTAVPIKPSHSRRGLRRTENDARCALKACGHHLATLTTRRIPTSGLLDRPLWVESRPRLLTGSRPYSSSAASRSAGSKS